MCSAAGHATESFSDFVVGHGELWSAQMLTYVIKKVCFNKFAGYYNLTNLKFENNFSLSLQSGRPCTWMDARDVLVVNPTSSNQVDPDFEESEKRLKKWFSHHSAETVVATGFIASTPQNIPTTLKRDGSDFSAAIFGSLVKASQVTIWTDVDGVYSADPRKGLPFNYI